MSADVRLKAEHDRREKSPRMTGERKESEDDNYLLVIPVVFFFFVIVVVFFFFVIPRLDRGIPRLPD